MECQSCAFNGIPEALALLTKTYTVSIAPRPSDNSPSSPLPADLRPKTTDTRELNPFEYKLARELSKRKPKKQVISALKSVIRNYKKIQSRAADLSVSFHKLSKISALANDDDAAFLARSAAIEYMNAVNACKKLKPIINSLLDNRSKNASQFISSLADLSRSHALLVEDIKSLLPDLQKICIGCSRTSNDDNLSRYGQVFVSIDAMNSLGLIASGADPSADLDDRSDPTEAYNGDSDPNDKEDSDSVFSALDSRHHDDLRDSSANTSVSQTAHDYLLSHTVADVHYQDPDASSKLPAHIEDLLRKHLSDFNNLDTFEKFLCFSQWSDQSFAEFGTMKWVPQELKKQQSKQFVTQRWNRLVEKFPLAAALRKGRICSSINSDLARHYNDEAFEQQDLPFDQSDLELSLPSTKHSQSLF